MHSPIQENTFQCCCSTPTKYLLYLGHCHWKKYLKSWGIILSNFTIRLSWYNHEWSWGSWSHISRSKVRQYHNSFIKRHHLRSDCRNRFLTRLMTTEKNNNENKYPLLPVAHFSPVMVHPHSLLVTITTKQMCLSQVIHSIIFQARSDLWIPEANSGSMSKSNVLGTKILAKCQKINVALAYTSVNN